jgi:hypothetical protein
MTERLSALSPEEIASAEAAISSRFRSLGRFKVIGPSARLYNCIAWAAGEAHQRWWPHDDYWPPQVISEVSLPAFQAAFRTLGYEPCGQNDLLEARFEKVALFVCGVVPSHAARQLAHGWWTSKLGDNWVIEHESLRGLEGALYGRVALVMKRPRIESTSSS